MKSFKALPLAPFFKAREAFNNRLFFKNVVLIASGTAAAQIVTMLSTPVVTRLYTPSDFGVLTVFTALIGVLGPLSTLRYAVTIPLAENEGLADNLIRLCFLITLLLSLIILIIVLLFGNFFAARFSFSYVASYLWILPAGLLGAGLYETLSSWAQRRKHFSVIARTKISRGISSSGIKIGLGWLNIKPLG